MHCLREFHEINACRLGWVSPSVSCDSYLQVSLKFDMGEEETLTLGA